GASPQQTMLASTVLMPHVRFPIALICVNLTVPTIGPSLKRASEGRASLPLSFATSTSGASPVIVRSSGTVRSSAIDGSEDASTTLPPSPAPPRPAPPPPDPPPPPPLLVTASPVSEPD